MPKTKTFDPRSAAVTLRYLGDASGEPHIAGFPARDLSDNDLARLVWLRSDRSKSAVDVTPQQAANLVTMLTASGLYAVEENPT